MSGLKKFIVPIIIFICTYMLINFVYFNNKKMLLSMLISAGVYFILELLVYLFKLGSNEDK